jgi:hypothetical protein
MGEMIFDHGEHEAKYDITREQTAELAHARNCVVRAKG